MTKSARSIMVFGIYLVLLGTPLIICPNFILKIFGVPATQEVWIRVVGVILLLLGYLYVQSARKNIKELFGITVYTRSSIIVFFSAFVLLGYAQPVLILFGIIDLLGASWTLKELKTENN